MVRIMINPRQPIDAARISEGVVVLKGEVIEVTDAEWKNLEPQAAHNLPLWVESEYPVDAPVDEADNAETDAETVQTTDEGEVNG